MYFPRATLSGACFVALFSVRGASCDRLSAQMPSDRTATKMLFIFEWVVRAGNAIGLILLSILKLPKCVFPAANLNHSFDEFFTVFTVFLHTQGSLTIHSIFNSLFRGGKSTGG
jgi:hypothetical protein